MQITAQDKQTLIKALEVALQQDSAANGAEYKQVLHKLQQASPAPGQLDGIRFDYTD